EGTPYLYLMLNRNKKAISLNLKKKEGIDLLCKILEDADVLLEGFRPGALAGMGLPYEELQKKFPRLIYCAISGYGDSGPYRDFAGHDANYLALSGLLDLKGEKDGAPSLLGFQLADIGGGSLIALSSILAALYYREKTGRGQKIDVSMMEASLQYQSLYLGIYLSTGKVPERGAELLNGKLPNYSIYPVKSGRYVVLAALEERFFRVFLRQAGMEEEFKKWELIEENFEKMKDRLLSYFAGKTLEELEPIFMHSDCCLSPIKNLQEVLKDKHLIERDMFFKMKHPKYGELKQLSSPFRFSETPCSYHTIPPEHGEHNEKVYMSIGLSNEEIQDYKNKRII
ncbi:MAG: CoA transferase, partial [Leptospiraceae bacterium]|nr:CoA transferase [Leptospiraceae bacterium]